MSRVGKIRLEKWYESNVSLDQRLRIAHLIIDALPLSIAHKRSALLGGESLSPAAHIADLPNFPDNDADDEDNLDADYVVQPGRIVYKKYGSLWFVGCITLDSNALLALEAIHRYVELLDHYFGNVLFFLFLKNRLLIPLFLIF